ncbi:hypothetical protein Y1Q_0020893 [Alligator mississippiensis]|uniref:Uncharacterized protein n=1 Tax=Alligator mississippiensis TaxID=8496 RepID=A0A151NJ93_ALLMI|nr:hypothetical protein Y1Q_0020893 [Alligator mississippiensis]
MIPPKKRVMLNQAAIMAGISQPCSNQGSQLTAPWQATSKSKELWLKLRLPASALCDRNQRDGLPGF